MFRLTGAVCAALALSLAALPAEAQDDFDWSRVSPVEKLMARRAARLDALRELGELIKTLPIGDGRQLGDLDPEIGPFLAGARETQPAQFAGSGFCKLQMTLDPQRVIGEAKRLADARRTPIDVGLLQRALGNGLEVTGLGRPRSAPTVTRRPTQDERQGRIDPMKPDDRRQAEAQPREAQPRERMAEQDPRDRGVDRRDDPRKPWRGTTIRPEGARSEGEGVRVESRDRMRNFQSEGWERQPVERLGRKDPRVEAWEREWQAREQQWNREFEQMRRERWRAQQHPWARPEPGQERWGQQSWNQQPQWTEMAIDEQYRRGRPIGGGWRQLPDGSRVRLLSERTISRRPVARSSRPAGDGATIIEETIEERVIERRFVVK